MLFALQGRVDDDHPAVPTAALPASKASGKTRRTEATIRSKKEVHRKDVPVSGIDNEKATLSRKVSVAGEGDPLSQLRS